MSDEQLLQHYLLLQALVAFEGCQAVLLDKGSTEADPTMPSAEVQAKLHEVFQPEQTMLYVICILELVFHAVKHPTCCVKCSNSSHPRCYTGWRSYTHAACHKFAYASII